MISWIQAASGYALHLEQRDGCFAVSWKMQGLFERMLSNIIRGLHNWCSHFTIQRSNEINGIEEPHILNLGLSSAKTGTITGIRGVPLLTETGIFLQLTFRTEQPHVRQRPYTLGCIHSKAWLSRSNRQYLNMHFQKLVLVLPAMTILGVLAAPVATGGTELPHLPAKVLQLTRG